MGEMRKKGARDSKVGSGDKRETDKKCNYAVFKNQANCNCVTDLARGVDKMLTKRSFKKWYCAPAGSFCWKKYRNDIGLNYCFCMIQYKVVADFPVGLVTA